jgi:DNA-binding MarR family transcriptional regulator
MTDKQKRVMRALKNLGTEQGHETYQPAYVVAARAEVDNRTAGPVLRSLERQGLVEAKVGAPNQNMLWRLSEQGRSTPLQ